MKIEANLSRVKNIIKKLLPCAMANMSTGFVKISAQLAQIFNVNKLDEHDLALAASTCGN